MRRRDFAAAERSSAGAKACRWGWLKVLDLAMGVTGLAVALPPNRRGMVVGYQVTV